MADNQLKISDPSIAPLVSSSKQLDDHRWQVTLIDGTTMEIDDKGNRIEGTVKTPFGFQEKLAMDDVGDIRHATAPSDLTTSKDDPGASSHWDLHSIEDAERWLRAHADTLGRLWRNMDEITDLLDGPDGHRSALGTFDWANKLVQQHTAVFNGVKTGLENTVESLYDAADAVRDVATNIKNAEERNQMTAEQMEKIFSDQGKGKHDF
jgi:uncharacterized protein YukE